MKERAEPKQAVAVADFDLDNVRARLKAGKAVTIPDIRVTSTCVHGHPLLFCWRNPDDPIQGRLGQGGFYEAEELAAIAQHFPIGGTFVDIGANVGNHSLYAAKFLSASKVIPIEPNPQVIPLLVGNIVLNQLTARFDLSHVGLGLSDKEASGFGMELREKNIGGARMLPGEGGLRVVTGDSILKAEAPSFIKIDVEGMEMKVLAGLVETLARHKPAIFVEVDRRNYADFDAWLATSGYVTAKTFSRYRANTNFLLEAKV